MKIEADGSVTMLNFSQNAWSQGTTEPDVVETVITAQQASAIRMIVQQQLKEQEDEN